MKIVIDDKIPFLRGVLEPFAEVCYVPGSLIKKHVAADADALVIRTRTLCNESLLKGTRVRFIASATIGIDHIDLDYCNDNGIHWANAPGCNAGSVQHYVALVLACLSRKLNMPLDNLTMGIVGVGHVGLKVQQLATALGMKTLLNDPPRARLEGGGVFLPLDELLRTSDIVTLHVPLHMKGHDKTYHLLDEQLLESLKKDAILINTARGEVVDTEAVKKSLQRGNLLAAALDVWEHEPEIDPVLLGLAAIATPHIAGYAQEGKAAGTEMTVQSLARFFGWPLTKWLVPTLPDPQQPIIALDGAGKRSPDIVIEAIDNTYNLMADDTRLRTDVGSFEHQRGNYPIRRDFGAFTVQLHHPAPGAVEALQALGFRVLVE